MEPKHNDNLVRACGHQDQCFSGMIPSGMDRCSDPDFLFGWSWIWNSSGLRELQQIQQ